jgi:hypothetical protein
MSKFLSWNNETDANSSLSLINIIYGCPYEEGGYTMFTWDVVTKSDAENKWGFFKPVPKLGKTQAELDAVLEEGYTEHQQRPSNWLAPSDES